MKIFKIIRVCVGVIGLAACGDSTNPITTVGNPGGIPSDESGLQLARSAVQSTPQIHGGLAVTQTALKSLLKAQEGEPLLSSGAQTVIENFFKLECHWDNSNSVNFCPDTIEEDFSTKFTTTTLIGLMAHADMYLANIYTPVEMVVDPITGETATAPTYKTCGRGDHPAELTDHTPDFEPDDGDTFVVDFGDLFDCVGDFDFTSGGVKNYALYSKSEDDLVFASLTSRKQVQGTESYVGVMSDIFQSTVSRDSSGNVVMLGFNLASFDEKGTDDYAGRSVLLTNIAESKFVVKYVSGTGSYNQIVALGKAGYDPSTSTWVEGTYMVKVQSGTAGAETICLQNGSMPTVVDDSLCAEVSGFFSDSGWTAAELHNYLGTNETDRANLSGFDGFFADADLLATDPNVLPANGSDFFPDSISE